MTFLDLVKKRTSVREYGDRLVSRETIGRCLEAARLAPSACNSQPWQFIVVDDPALCKKLANAAFSGVHSMNTFAKSAPVLIVVIRKPSGTAPTLGGILRGIQYNLIDIGIACEHFVLQAAEEGVGTCWLGWFDANAVKKVLNLSKGTHVDIIISMGYPAGEINSEKNRKPLNEISRFNK